MINNFYKCLLSLAVIVSSVTIQIQKAEARWGFGIGSLTHCYGTCPPGQTCTLVRRFPNPKDNGILDYWCECLYAPNAIAAPVDSSVPSVEVDLDISLTNGFLSFSGFVTDADSSDNILGTPISLSGNLKLFDTRQQLNGTGLAVFLPETFATVNFGNFLSATVESVSYVESQSEQPSQSSFSFTLKDIGMGTEPSDFVEETLNLIGLQGILMGVDSPIPLFSDIQTGNFSTINAKGLADSIAVVPEPTFTLSLLAFGTLGAASTLNRKLKRPKSTENLD